MSAGTTEEQAHAVHYLAGRLVTGRGLSWQVAADQVLEAVKHHTREPAARTEPKSTREQRRAAAKARRSRP